MERLTAQQASLIRSVARSDPEYLGSSYYVDEKTGKRIAHELEPDELTGFTASWAVSPMDCIRGLNSAVARIEERSRRERYVQAAVELEILMDEQSWLDDERVYQGIPEYLMHGYTDMGSKASLTDRGGREKIKVDKLKLRKRLAECKRRGLYAMGTNGDGPTSGPGPRQEGDAGADADAEAEAGAAPGSEGSRERVDEPGSELRDLLTWFYNVVRRDIEFNEDGVEKLSRDFGNESIVLSKYLEKGLGVCRHLSIFFQLYLQEAGIDSKVVKGDLKFYIFKGRHAWNLAKYGDTWILVDVTHPNVSQPFFVMGSSEEEVYARARELSREYTPTPDEQNHYKIGAV
jgi:hypothetical protein